MDTRSLILPTLLTLSLPNVAAAAPGASGSSSKTPAKAAKDDDERDDPKWIRRWPPTRNMWEVGVYGGLFFPSKTLELFAPQPNRPDMGFVEYRPLALDVGGRVGFYPAKFLGLELEGGAMPSRTAADDRALIYHARGHVLAQLARWSVAPFVLAGLSGLGVASDPTIAGADIDIGFHFGGGAKIFLNRWTMLRLDARDTLTAKRGLGQSVTNSFEVLLGFSVTLGRAKPREEAPKDRDGDGFLDRDDKCVHEPGVAPHGCPVGDSDGDGFLDPDDACPTDKGVAPDGCPIGDKDGDGFLDDVDECPDEPGVEPHGCPIGDKDGDGIMDGEDACIDEPETKNGFKDADGCPDEVPKEVEAFSGVIERIFFDTSKATIKPQSRAKLDQAVEVLNKYGDVRLEISGHTDSKGKRDYNMELSERRADAVKKYLTDAGIDAGRLTTRGAGPDEPRDSNRTAEGRANNRRIEFRLLE